MDVIVRHKSGDYVTLSNICLFDNRLSLKAKGLYGIVMSLPDGFDFSVANVMSFIKEGKGCVYSSLDELKRFGYCKVSQIREGGRFVRFCYEFFESPISIEFSPFPNFPQMEKPQMENLQQKESKEMEKENSPLIPPYKEKGKESKEKKDIKNIFSEEKDNVVEEIDDNSKDDEKVNKIDLYNKISPEKKEKDMDFERAWKDYGRKGSKRNALNAWNRLSLGDRKKVLIHIPHYVSSREFMYRKDMQGYLNGRFFDTIVYDKLGNVVFDPERMDGNNGEYMPECGRSLHWNDQLGCYLFVGYDTRFIPDGYTDDNRPDGARIKLNNGRGWLTWDAKSKKWILSSI